MTRKQALVFALAVCASLGVIASYKLGPRLYNRHRLGQLQGRNIYDTSIKARPAFDESLQRAQREHKQLLVILGGNWCQWCLVLDELLHEDEELRDYLSANFVVLKLDSASAKELDEQWGHPTRHGVPVLIFVDAKGSVTHIQETESLEMWHGRILAHDRRRVLGVLERWRGAQS
jgi:thiol:disulfide interchange protein